MLSTMTIDVGTTSVKISRLGADGEALEVARHPTPTQRDDAGEVYDVAVLWRMVTGFVDELGPEGRAAVERVAVTGVGESGGLVRPDGSLASPVVLWHDQRGAPAVAALDDSARRRVFAVTGLPTSASYGISKVAWLLDRSDVDPEEVRWLNVSELLAARMTGALWSEPSLASRTMALDLDSRAWSDEVCALFGVAPAVFPELRADSDGVAVSPDFVRETGLRPEVRVHVAGHDHMVGAVGADLRRGELLNSTGTTEGLLMLREAPLRDDHARLAKLANGVAVVGDDTTVFASIPTGGAAFETLQALLGLDAAGLTTAVAAAHRRWTAGGVDLDRVPLVLPWFRGSPPPRKDTTATGAISGLRGDTSADDVVLGCFLGMVLQFADVLELFRSTPERVKVIGPASRNPLWNQLKADLLGRPLSVARSAEVVSRGAQALASGQPSSWEACDPVEVVPDPERHRALALWRERVRPRWEHLVAGAAL